MNLDTHFHIFQRASADTENARYSISYDATLENWHQNAASQGVAGGVIVQPSFLAFDNSLLLAAIQQNPSHLKGVVCLSPSTPSSELMVLREQGIRGVRLNLYGEQNPLAVLEKNLGLIESLSATNLHLQIHHDDGLLNALLLGIPKGVKIIVDHFGRPASNDEFIVNSAGIEKHTGSLWVKLSAQYRTPLIDHQKIFQYWREAIGDDHLLWGSDWPHTQFENTQSYESQIKDLHTLTADPLLIKKILSTNPKDLYWS